MLARRYHHQHRVSGWRDSENVSKAILPGKPGKEISMPGVSQRGKSFPCIQAGRMSGTSKNEIERKLFLLSNCGHQAVSAATRSGEQTLGDGDAGKRRKRGEKSTPSRFKPAQSPKDFRTRKGRSDQLVDQWNQAIKVEGTILTLTTQFESEATVVCLPGNRLSHMRT